MVIKSRMAKESANDLRYQAGLGNVFESEALPGALPKAQNSPQKAPLGLYAEQLTGSSFTAPAGENLKTWQYKIQPSVVHPAFRPAPAGELMTAPFPVGEFAPSPNPMRWNPLPYPTTQVDFVQGLRTIAANGNVSGQFGCAT